MSQQKRQAPRVPIEIRVEYRRMNAFIADFTRDISGQGLFVRTDHPLDEGTECVFTLTIPALAEPLSLQGVVRRVVRPEDVDEGAGDDAPGMGVELVFEDEAERAALQTLVDDLMFQHLGEALYEKMRRLS